MVRIAKDHKRLNVAWEKWGMELCGGLGLSALPLRDSSKGILLLLYKPRLLRKVLTGPAGRYLCSLLYPVDSGITACLEELNRRFNISGNIPHEVGIFLGYPLEDVIDFIRGNKKAHPCKGCWKVYHRPERASRIFNYINEARIRLVQEAMI
ncbi:DUF3793 family protein [Breznakiella homolactica]|uniref:DUF3793 family protein n=2 Tax=Breznakiella homolactica TaxID=2798577 RepID=A0A7T7XQ49_9SPIR|nr:DUF3793 family protein [Breznakiella homolactica]